MTIYSVSDVVTIGNADARVVLTGTGLPDSVAMPFRPAPGIEVWSRDPQFAILGHWDDQIPVLAHRQDGDVSTAPPWSDEIDPLNSSVRNFAESLRALDDAHPLSRTRFGTSVAAGRHAEALLREIDPETYDDPYSFWQAIVSDIKNGDFSTDPPG